jgi:alanine racemase
LTPRELAERVAFESAARPTSGPPQRWAEIDLDAIRHNVRFPLDRLPAGTRLIAVVKADGYGHGARRVAEAALEAGAWGLGVSTPTEAADLGGLVEPERRLVLGGLAPANVPEAIAAGCAATCHSPDMLEALEARVPRGARLPVHLKVDSGMGRLGCTPAQAPALARRIAGGERLRLAGVFTHFASSESDGDFTREQFEVFQRVLDDLDVDPGIRHAANSGAALRHPEMALDAVRCGIAIYGAEWPGLRPALSLRALVTQVKEVPAGGTVGYGRTWRAERPARIATVAIGYEDGVMRARSNRGEVVIAGRRAPVIGRVSMDQLTADVTEIEDARVGEFATVIGDGISAEEVATWSGTISYEVLISLGNRVKRIYKPE